MTTDNAADGALDGNDQAMYYRMATPDLESILHRMEYHVLHARDFPLDAESQKQLASFRRRVPIIRGILHERLSRRVTAVMTTDTAAAADLHNRHIHLIEARRAARDLAYRLGFLNMSNERQAVEVLAVLLKLRLDETERRMEETR